MKKTVRILLVSLVILVFASICVSALEQDGFTYSYNSTFQGMAITAYSGEDTELVIPAAFDDTPVTYIGKNAFAGKGLTSVQFPDTVACIGVQAFYNNPDLKNVVLPENLTVIRDTAFRNTGLQWVYIPAGVNTIGNSAFSNTPLTAIYFGGTKAQWEAISFGTDWDYGTSDYTLYYTENDLLFTLENGEAIVADYSGNGVNVVIPQTLGGAPVTTVDEYAFSFYDTIQSATLPNGLTSIGECAFFACESLESVNIPSSVTFIGEGAFMGTSLTEITIPAGIQTIEDSTFSGALLVQATIPASVTTIGANAFRFNEDLADIYYGGTKAEWEAISFGDLWDYDTGSFTVHCSDGDIAPADPLDFLTYTVANGEATVTGFETDKSVDILVIPATLGGAPVTTIGEDAFKNSNVLQITLPDSVTSIEANAFKSSNLESINIPSGVFFIGDNAFASSYLTDVTLPAGLQAINERAFYFAELESITIPASVTYIGDYALARNYELENIYFGGTKAQWGAIVFGEDWNAIMPEVYTVHCSDGDLVHDPESDYTFVIENGEASLTGYTGSDLNITIPSTLGGAPVVEIDEGAFENSSIKSVVIPEGVKYIRTWAFEDAHSLEIVTLPSTLVSIKGGAFYRCESLGTIVIPEGVTAINVNTFYGCSNLKTVNLPASVTFIDERAFYNCSVLTHIYFAGTKAQWNAITKGENWDYGTPSPEVHCSDDEASESDFTYTVEDGAAKVTGYTGYAKIVNIPSTLGGYPVKRIGDSAFKNKDITSVVIPEGVTQIISYAFTGCTSLANVTLPDTLEWIGSYTFRNCSALTEIDLPGTLSGTGNGLFDECTSLADIYFDGTEEQWNAINFAENWAAGMPAGCTIHFFELFPYTVKDGKATVTGYNGTDTDIVIPSTLGGYPVTAIGKEAFRESGLTSVVIPEGVTSIGDSAFMQNYNLYSVTIPQSVTYIGSSALSGCNLSTINVPNPDAVLGAWAFAANSHLYDVTLPANLTAIPANLFASCGNLEEIHIPGSVTSIGASAFYNCKKLADIYFDAFEDDWNAISFGEDWNLNMPAYTVHCMQLFTYEQDKMLGGYNITGYNGKDTEIVIPAQIDGHDILAISDSAFVSANFTKVVISEGIKNIYFGAFEDCSSLEKLTLPASLKYVENNAFYGCSSLTDIYYGAYPEDWNEINFISGWDEGAGAYTVHYAKTHLPQNSVSVSVATPASQKYGMFYFTVNCRNDNAKEVTVTLIAAAYDENGRFVGYDFREETMSAGANKEYAFFVTAPADATIKVFVLDESSNPLIQALQVK